MLAACKGPRWIFTDTNYFLHWSQQIRAIEVEVQLYIGLDFFIIIFTNYIKKGNQWTVQLTYKTQLYMYWNRLSLTGHNVTDDSIPHQAPSFHIPDVI